MNKKSILTIVIVTAIVALGFVGYRQIAAKQAAVDMPLTETAVVERGDLTVSIDATGSLTPRMEIGLAFASGGQVAETLVVRGGQVEAGQALIRLDTRDLEWQVEQARLSLTLAELDLSEARDWYTEGDEPVQISLAKMEQAKISLQQAEWRLEQATLNAPVGGVVTALLIEPGETANSGQTVVVISDLSNLDVEVNVDETDVSRLADGMEVQVSLDAFPGNELTGRVTYIEPAATVESGVVLYVVTVALDPAELPLRSGMTVSVIFPIEQRTDTLLVPFRAIETEGGQAYLTRVTAAGSERVAVTLGLITDTQVEILAGIDEGDVVTVYANPVQDSELMRNPMFGGGQ
ncbi:MAG: efflux RND transporter periplasmic adaptor subunit [Chloroflexota bacterium]